MSDKKGFTIIEMLIVLAIIGVVLSITYPSIVSTMKISRDNDRYRNKIVVDKALKQYRALTGRYPNYKLPDDVLALKGDLYSQTGVTLDVANYTYTYTATCTDIDGDGKYEISSLDVD